MNILFVCSRNQWRSPTAEKLWKRRPGVSTRSAGTSPHAKRTVSPADLRWADVICVMESKHKNRLLAMFPRAAVESKIFVLEIPDDYQYMDEELVELLEASVGALLQALQASTS